MPPGDISRLLHDLREGRQDALAELLPLVYDELSAMAHHRLRRGARALTLDTTDLVNEAYLKLFGRNPIHWQDRRLFFSVAALAIKQIVFDRARKRAAQKRGGAAQRVDLDVANLPVDGDPEEMLILQDALSRLSLMNERHARIVELRFFTGLSIEETAEVLGISPATVKRDWLVAKAWLRRELSG